QPSEVTLEVFNYHGEKVKTLLPASTQKPGKHSLIWDATNDAGDRAPNGIYFYIVRLPHEMISGKMILMD
ncbi:MAG: hypothetical protein K8S16_11935, partial [Bacteroidales bacterium]|nr:hypothetical protein [Bacteroidales bacterium]